MLPRDLAGPEPLECVRDGLVGGHVGQAQRPPGRRGRECPPRPRPRRWPRAAGRRPWLVVAVDRPRPRPRRRRGPPPACSATPRSSSRSSVSSARCQGSRLPRLAAIQARVASSSAGGSDSVVSPVAGSDNHTIRSRWSSNPSLVYIWNAAWLSSRTSSHPATAPARERGLDRGADRALAEAEAAQRGQPVPIPPIHASVSRRPISATAHRLLVDHHARGAQVDVGAVDAVAKAGLVERDRHEVVREALVEQLGQRGVVERGRTDQPRGVRVPARGGSALGIDAVTLPGDGGATVLGSWEP